VSPLVSCPAFYIELEFNGKPAGTFSWYLGQETGVNLVVERRLGWLIAYDILPTPLVNERLIQLSISLLVHLCLCHLCYTTLVLLYNKGIIRVQYISNHKHLYRYIDTQSVQYHYLFIYNTNTQTTFHPKLVLSTNLNVGPDSLYIQELQYRILSTLTLLPRHLTL
jgi:hypothetical protein